MDRTPSFRQLLELSWPIVVTRSSQSVIGFSDALMTARLGASALAATTTGAINVFALVILPMGMAFIVQSFSSQLIGAGRAEAARRYAWYGLILAGGFGLIGLAAIPAVPWVLGLLAYEPAVAALMSDYIAIRLLAVGAIVGTEALGNWYGGLGHTRLQMVAGLVSMVANVFLNWVLIYGKLGAPALGVRGAALASTIASWLGFVFLAWVFGRGWVIAPTRRLGLRFSEFVRVLRFGYPHGLNWFLEFAAFALFLNVMVVELGTTVLAAMMVVFNINSVSFMPAFGLATGGAILSGQAIGAGQRDKVGAIVKRTLAIAASWQGLVGLAYLSVPALLMGWFAPPGASGEALLRVGTAMLAISAAWQLFDAVAMVMSETLRAAGDTAWCLWARLSLAWVLFIPAAALAVFVLRGTHLAAISTMVIYLAALAAALAWRFRQGAWRRIDLTGAADELLAV